MLSQDSDNVDALRFSALHALTRESRPEEAAQRIRALCSALDRQEPRNAALYYSSSRTYARVAGRDARVLEVSAPFPFGSVKVSTVSCLFPQLP